MSKSKLFIWPEFEPDEDFNYGLAFAIAENEEKAKVLVMESLEMTNDSLYSWGKLEIHHNVTEIGKAVFG